MIKAFVKYWKGYAHWEGRVSPSEWWWVVLCNFIIEFFFMILISIAEPNHMAAFFDFDVSTPFGISLLVILVLYDIATITPGISFNVRRLRDAGFHWALIFLKLIPILGKITVFILVQFPSKDNVNSTNNPILIDNNL